MIKRRAIIDMSVELLHDRILSGTTFLTLPGLDVEILGIEIDHFSGVAKIVLSGESLPRCAELCMPMLIHDIDVRSEDD